MICHGPHSPPREETTDDVVRLAVRRLHRGRAAHLGSVVKYPLRPLAQLAGLTDRGALVAMKVSGKQYQQYRDDGMTREVADRMAVRLGLHPYEVWPEMADNDMNDVDTLPLEGQPCAAQGCEERFIPGRGRRYCSSKCRGRAKRKRQGKAADRGPRECASIDCSRVFTPEVRSGPVDLYCSKTCRIRENMRAYRATEAGRESNRRQKRKYDAEVRELIARRQERRAA